MRALRVITMAGLLGMAMPTSGGLLDMAAAPAKAKEQPPFDEAQIEQLLEIKNKFGTMSPEYINAYKAFMRQNFGEEPSGWSPGKEPLNEYLKKRKGADKK